MSRRARLLLAAAALLVGLHAAVIATRRDRPSDFDVSREFGRRFLAGEPLYAGGLHYPYMPAAALFFSPLALVPAGLGLALRYAVALGALAATLALLAARTRARLPALASQRFAVASLALGLAAHYVVRDLDDGGPHLILLAIAALGIALADRRREVAAAVAFGLAGAIKAPMLLFLPFFWWTGRRRLALWSAAAALAWIALPLAQMDASSWWRHQSEWLGHAVSSSLGSPLPGADESEARVQNQALGATATRLAAGSGAPAAGTRLARWLAIAAALLAFAAATRRRPRPERDPIGPIVANRGDRASSPATEDAPWLVDCAALLLLGALLSPVTWVQHLVVALPALYLALAEHRAGPGLGRPWLAVLAAYAFLSLVLNRELIGREAYLHLLALGLHTWCMLLLLALLLRRRPASGPG